MNVYINTIQKNIFILPTQIRIYRINKVRNVRYIFPVDIEVCKFPFYIHNASYIRTIGSIFKVFVFLPVVFSAGFLMNGFHFRFILFLCSDYDNRVRQKYVL